MLCVIGRWLEGGGGAYLEDGGLWWTYLLWPLHTPVAMMLCLATDSETWSHCDCAVNPLKP